MTTITCIEQFKNEIRPFKEIQIPRRSRWAFFSPYKHHVFVSNTDADGCDIYHYTSTTSKLCCIPIPKGKIIKERLQYETYKASSLFDFDNGDVVFIVDRTDYPQTRAEKKECLKRANERLHEEKYSMSFNNCESYVNWIFSRDNTSSQVTESTRNQYLALVIDEMNNLYPSVIGMIMIFQIICMQRGAIDIKIENLKRALLRIEKTLDVLDTFLFALEGRIQKVDDKQALIFHHLNLAWRYLQK